MDFIESIAVLTRWASEVKRPEVEVRGRGGPGYSMVRSEGKLATVGGAGESVGAVAFRVGAGEAGMHLELHPDDFEAAELSSSGAELTLTFVGLTIRVCSEPMTLHKQPER